MKDGISSCCNCNRVFDTSRYHQILSLSWTVRKQHITDSIYLVERFEADQDIADFVIEYVADGCYSHQEFAEVLNASSILNSK
jgi:hypothetical protein